MGRSKSASSGSSPVGSGASLVETERENVDEAMVNRSSTLLSVPFGIIRAPFYSKKISNTVILITRDMQTSNKFLIPDDGLN